MDRVRCDNDEYEDVVVLSHLLGHKDAQKQPRGKKRDFNYEAALDHVLSPVRNPITSDINPSLFRRNFRISLQRLNC